MYAQFRSVGKLQKRFCLSATSESHFFKQRGARGRPGEGMRDAHANMFCLWLLFADHCHLVCDSYLPASCRDYVIERVYLPERRAVLVICVCDLWLKDERICLFPPISPLIMEDRFATAQLPIVDGFG
ncbi:hypothetical protein AYI70_g7304 [Smittium culicis]|uniref:Uncharacterized protein n=1 Tax=Smittium culicis TaxID=133412 RepID=A0A1R1XLA9_9FUNG|nr:hypothetical protein AYI70_g7304 [Smittium culicis]